MSPQQIEHVFRTPPLNQVGEKKNHEIVELFDEMYTRLSEICPPGREFALVWTHLEQAAMYATKAISGVAGNQQTGEGTRKAA